MNDQKHERIIRRGIQLFQLAVLMEIGDAPSRRGQGTEALFYMADAIARLAALSADPRLALDTVSKLFGKTSDDWYERHRTHESTKLPPASHLISDITFETVIGQKDPESALAGFAVDALERLTDAIIDIASLNNKPHSIIEHVKKRLDAADIKSKDLLS